MLMQIMPVEKASMPRPNVACSNCSLRELCLPVGLSETEMEQMDSLVYTRRRIRAGATLYRSEERFQSLYAVRSGFFKTSVMHEDGREQMTGFQMNGELLGIDGIGTDFHTVTARALEDSEVCIIPFGRLESLSREMHTLQHHFHKVMSKEIVRDHGIMMLLGSMRAEERLAAFLLNLSHRYTMRGYSHADFHLRMTRQDIGSYLGLKLETVSRIFSKFQNDGLVSVRQKHIQILNVDGLKAVMGGAPC